MANEFLDKYEVEFETRIGRAGEGKTFVEVIHIPTNKSRFIAGLGGKHPQDVAERFKIEIIKELGLK